MTEADWIGVILAGIAAVAVISNLLSRRAARRRALAMQRLADEWGVTAEVRGPHHYAFEVTARERQVTVTYRWRAAAMGMDNDPGWAFVCDTLLTGVPDVYNATFQRTGDGGYRLLNFGVEPRRGWPDFTSVAPFLNAAGHLWTLELEATHLIGRGPVPPKPEVINTLLERFVEAADELERAL